MTRAHRASVAVGAAILLSTLWTARAVAQDDAPVRIDRGRFTLLCYPGDSTLARSLLNDALARDTFPGLPRPRQRVAIAIAPDARRFRAWTGTGAPEWGVAVAFPASRRIVMQGHRAGAEAGDPRVTLRHELAHLVLHEWLADAPPRWFDEGYASVSAGERDRQELLATNVALALRGVPTLAQLDSDLTSGVTQAGSAYALAYEAVLHLASLDPKRGLSLFFGQWMSGASMDVAIRRAYGMTLDGFEQQWRARTRRRYGGLALMADLTLATLLIAIALVPFAMARRRRDAKRLALMRLADEAAERAARESAIAAMLAPDTSPAPDKDVV